MQRPLFTRHVHMHLTPACVAHARGALRLVGGRRNNVGVSLRERLDTAQVMLGVSLRARWVATLLKYTVREHAFSVLFNNYIYSLLYCHQ